MTDTADRAMQRAKRALKLMGKIPCRDGGVDEWRRGQALAILEATGLTGLMEACEATVRASDDFLECTDMHCGNLECIAAKLARAALTDKEHTP